MALRRSPEERAARDGEKAAAQEQRRLAQEQAAFDASPPGQARLAREAGQKCSWKEMPARRDVFAYWRDAPGRNRTSARGLGNRCSIH
jgi:hypothetical protein